MAAKTGIHDADLLAELADLGLTAGTLTSIRLIPVVLVAWADKHVDSAERKAVLNQAGALGIAIDSDAYVLLDHWMRTKPGAESAKAWKQYIKTLLAKMGDGPRAKFAAFCRSQMMAVAKASGGHFGIGKVSAQERRVIDGLMEVFD